MKKYLVPFGLFFLALTLFTGCGKKTEDATNNESSLAPNDQDVQNVPVTEDNKEEGFFSGSIKDLMAKGTNVQCDWSSDQDMNKASGTIYVSGNKFFQDYSSVQPEIGEVKGNVVNDGEWIYQWNSFSQKGTKMKAKEAEEMAKEVVESAKTNPNNREEGQGSGGEAMDFSDSMDYKCKSWNVDASKFQPPSNIEFQDLSQMMNNLPKINGSGLADLCKACDTLPAEAKASCLEGCSK